MTHVELFEAVRLAVKNDAAGFRMKDCCFEHFFSLIDLQMEESDSSEVIRRLALGKPVSTAVNVSLLHRWENDCEEASEIVSTSLGLVTQMSESDDDVEIEVMAPYWELIPKGSPGYVADEVYGLHVPAFL